MPVFIDEHGASRCFLPDELTAQFADGVQPDEAEAAMRELGSAIVIA